MRLIQKLWVCTLAMLLMLSSGATLATTVDIAGVKFEDSIMLDGTKLQLNGAGVRTRLLFKVYAAGLYTTKKVHSFEEFMAAPGPKRMKMVFLREIDSSTFGKLLTRGVQDNVTKEQLSPMVPGLLRMGEMFNANKAFVSGESNIIDWIPGKGLVITVKDKVQGEPIKEIEFFRGLMSVWFGPSPADGKLRDALLDIKQSGTSGTTASP